MSTPRLYQTGDKERARPISSIAKSRTEFRRDYGRLLHSPAFRRLQGKTQLYPGAASDFFRNRLTHSLEVAQIAKGIAERINASVAYFKKNPLDLDLVEFAGLAHDLGHPPFGHNGEHALDQCMILHGGFEGNAQTLRILSRIEKKETIYGEWTGFTDDGGDTRLGLNLTYRTLAAVLKYDKIIPQCRKPGADLEKGYYASEAPLVQIIKRKVIPSLPLDMKFKTIECQIMDLADDIAYSTYDLEDGLKGGFFNPISLLTALRSDHALRAAVTKKVKETVHGVTENRVLRAIADIFDFTVEGQPKAEKNASPSDAYSQAQAFCVNGYARAALTSALVNSFISGVNVVVNKKYPVLSEIQMDRETLIQVETLKHLNFEYTIMSPRLKLIEYRGDEIVTGIFEALTQKGGHLLLPPDCRSDYLKMNDETQQKRLICDFVAGMTDRYAVEFYGRLKDGTQSIFTPM